MNQTLLQHALDNAWNALVPKCAKHAAITEDGRITYTHPTKGRRVVSGARFRAQLAVRGVR